MAAARQAQQVGGSLPHTVSLLHLTHATLVDVAGDSIDPELLRARLPTLDASLNSTAFVAVPFVGVPLGDGSLWRGEAAERAARRNPQLLPAENLKLLPAHEALLARIARDTRARAEPEQGEGGGGGAGAKRSPSHREERRSSPKRARA
jgi:hypothetical protein